MLGEEDRNDNNKNSEVFTEFKFMLGTEKVILNL